MAFARKTVEVKAVLFDELTAPQVEKMIIEGVKKYATKTETWSKATKNTPFLGTVIGMGIESANLVDVTMSIERQFLTRKTKKVLVNAETNEYKLEDGEIGKLVIPEGHDALVATPGLGVKMLMESGHLKMDQDYLRDVVSFAYTVVVGEGCRINESIQRFVGRLERAPDEATKKDWLGSLHEQTAAARRYLETVKDPARLAEERKKTYLAEKERFDALSAEIAAAAADVEKATDDMDRSSRKNKLAALKLRSNKMKLFLRVSEMVAKDCGQRSPTESEEVTKVCHLLEGTLAGLSPEYR